MFDFLSSLSHTESDAPASTVLVAGLGNPGREYRGNRHNAGFMVIDRLCEELGARLGRMQSKALTGSATRDGVKIVLAKPQTFMNLSGQSVAALLRFYKIPREQLLVIHDDLDLPFGTLRLRPGGGPGGQKGVGSIIQQLGTQDFARLRIGIGRPPGRMDPASYVLHDFAKDEQEFLPVILKQASDAALVWATTGLDKAMNLFNGAVLDE